MHEVTEGETLSQKWNIGLPAHTNRPRLSECVSVIGGVSGVGKTSLVASNPEALILNLDVSTTPGSENLPARVWPSRRRGLIVEEDPKFPNDIERAKPIRLTWESLIRVIDDKIDKLAISENRPSLIVIDTLDEMIDLAKDYVHRNAFKFGEGGAESFSEISAFKSWPKVREITEYAIKKLHRQMGFGVCVLVQLTEIDHTEIQGGDLKSATNRRVLKPATNRKTFESIMRSAEYVFQIDHENTRSERLVPMRNKEGEVVLGPDGQPKMRKTTETSPQRVLTGTLHAFDGTTKTRHPLKSDRLVLPTTGGWAALEEFVAGDGA